MPGLIRVTERTRSSDDTEYTFGKARVSVNSAGKATVHRVKKDTLFEIEHIDFESLNAAKAWLKKEYNQITYPEKEILSLCRAIVAKAGRKGKVSQKFAMDFVNMLLTFEDEF